MWSIDFRIGIVVTALVFLIGIGATIFFLLCRSRAAANKDEWYITYHRRDDMRFRGICASISLAVTLILMLFAVGFFYPWKAEYHQIRPVTGTVQAVSSRLLSDGDKGMNQKFVVKINGQEYGCNDTRCSLVKVGDTLTLGCQRVWEFGSTDGYDCVFRANHGQ